MFQTFDIPSDRSQGPRRLAQLRDVLRAYTTTRTRAGAMRQPQDLAYLTTKGVYLGG